jgi:uroporphyrinogen-III synthase
MPDSSAAQVSGHVKRVNSILIDQPTPERSPYFELAEKYAVRVDWRTFIHVEGVPEKEFRKARVRPDEYPSVILTSKNAVDHYFRMCEEMRIKVSQDIRYFCLSEAVANYLQKFIVYRKRKVFAGTRDIQDLNTYLLRYRDSDEFLLPCSNLGSKPVTAYLDEKNIRYQEAMMYRTVSSDLSDLADITYDMLVFFSPLGIKSLFENFPDFKQRETRLAAYGQSTCEAVVEHGLELNVQAPSPNVPSMSMALENYLEISNKDSNGQAN